MLSNVRFLALLLTAGCVQYDFYTQRHTDVFQQKLRNTVDILVVVDNSCSMVEEQNKLATNFDSFIQYFQGVDVDYQIGVITTDTVQEQFSGKLVGGDDEIILRGPDSDDGDPGTVLDRVEYDAGWEVPSGASLALDPSITSSSYNDVRDYWCAGTTAFGAGDLGTPGAANPSCGAGGPEPDPEPVDSEAGPLTPTARDILITEFMASPSGGAETAAEWVELSNIASHALDLSGCTLSDGGRNRFVIPEGTLLEPGAQLVLARSDDSAQNGGIDGAIAMGDAFTLNDNLKIITPATEAPDEIFAEMVAQGTGGSGIEMGLEAARLALSEPLVATENAGFLRESANLALLFVSDEEDTSPYPVDSYTRFFTELKGEAAYRDHALFRASAVVGDTVPQFDGEPSCSSADGQAAYGGRYIDMAQRTEGLIDSICDEDFSPIALELGLTLSGLLVEFALSEVPDETTLQVSLYETADQASFVRTLVKDVDYVYQPDHNAIVFQDDQVPPSLWYIVVEYELQPEAAQEGG